MLRKSISRRSFLRNTAMLGAAAFLPLYWAADDQVLAAGKPLTFTGRSSSSYGEWELIVHSSAGYLPPGEKLHIEAVLTVPAAMAAALGSETGISDYLLLITAERCFDTQGRQRLACAERMSTLLTPTGLAIEGGSSGAVSRHTGSRHTNVIDQLVTVSQQQAKSSETVISVRFVLECAVPANIPPGLYRLRFDAGVVSGKRRYSLNKENFGQRPRELDKLSLCYSPVMLCSNYSSTGKFIDSATLVPHIYWVLLGQYNSNGYQGVVAEEDKRDFALSGRHIMPDEVILPLYNPAGAVISYNLEPQLPTTTVDRQCSLPLLYDKGELSLEITGPDGSITDLGTLPFAGTGKQGGPTTNNPRFTAWKPAGYGRYTVKAKGWLADTAGNRYWGGGTYCFWIAKRLTMGTATFQGQSYPAGASYGRDIGFSPPVPARVSVTATLYPYSDRKRKQEITYHGVASLGGIFGAAQGMKPLPLTQPGEYHGQVTAEYKDHEGHLWVCSMRHAGVVYPPDTKLKARGKKIKTGEVLAARGETGREGYVEPNDNFRHLEHINYPYYPGDVLLIASEGQGANKIEPVLTYTFDDDAPYDKRLNAIGASNLRIAAAGNLPPHQYPEYITDWGYYYAAAPRPGLSSRFLIGEDGVHAPYWPTSTSNFGGQFGASHNGDMPGDIYRLLGGVVLRSKGQVPQYDGYLASAFILPAGSRNNRVIPPGTEELISADGRLARFFMVPVRPGMVYEQGAPFTPVLQIDPIVPAEISFTLVYPDGQEKNATGSGDRFGYFAGKEKWLLDQPGVYTYKVKGNYQGNYGLIPGLTPAAGKIFVMEKTSAVPRSLKLLLKNQQGFTVEEGLLIEGLTSAKTVHYTMIMPGAVIEQGSISTVNGRFFYRFEPLEVHKKIPLYDVENRRSGRKEIGRIIHLTFFAAEEVSGGRVQHAYTRLIMRGNTAIYTY